MTEIFASVVFVVVYVLMATERVERVPAALCGAGLVFAAGAIDAHEAFFSQETGIDWNVIFLLLGMMIIVGVVSRTGLFDYLAMHAVHSTRGRPYLLMLLMSIITAVTSALLDNVTVMLLTIPIIFSICRQLALPLAPYLLTQVFASNIGGTATLIGDPPNLIIGSRSGLSFNDFLAHALPLVAIVLIAFSGLIWVLFHKQIGSSNYTPESFTKDDLIRDRKLLALSLLVLALVMTCFVLHSVIHTELSVIALLGAGVLILISGLRLEDTVQDVEWETLIFFIGLFIMVGALINTGSVERLADMLNEHLEDDLLPATFAVLGVSAVLSAVVDNVPYVAAVSPVIEQLVAGSSDPAQAKALWWALVFGADFGGNATIVGAGANIVMIGIAKRKGYAIRFWDFAKYGIIVTVMSIALAALYLWLRYF